ncbi:endo-1,3-alpha-glucanase family glycosylhydrolase [Coraliomargarita algicola]|uniref:Endo-1,3-alpha-glucanase family glycosylhydrolase n=1 Tax=Coraliomargarita algicola TaxID=3092156 RepID=A0ABZ0RMJ6_9BACT|nr:endo-1,3-alpha-glucanase family glycosylhydrolase [Coraliomargarita sp. J2-16]WPJ96648.1 endo-1,3-alpha-glucanase family glycosylhydrolase [Coraliomargarita sp. J2-16]
MNCIKWCFLFGAMLLGGGTFLHANEEASFGGDGRSAKMVWAHYIAWGFNFTDYRDNFNVGWRRLDDRSNLGSPLTSANEGLTSTTRTQILSAMQYGIDGFTVNIMHPNAYAGSMNRMYRAAEGLPFKISLCVDGFGARLPVEEVVEHMAQYFEKWGTHPNNSYIDGKPVVFIYHPRRSPEDCEEIVQQLKAKGHEAYWLVQPQREGTLWDDRDLIDRYLTAFDGLYDFGSNGISRENMDLRLSNGREALARAGRSDSGLLVAGITQGYNGSHNAFYRPFFGTGTLRDNWESAIAEEADWVCLTTWNDYIENTHFEPSEWDPGALLKINREYIRLWRGEVAPPRPPQVFASYKNEVRLGDDWTIELQAFPYTTPAQVCYTKITDLDGNLIKAFSPLELSSQEHTVMTYRLTHPGLDSPRYMRIWTAVADEATGESLESLEWRELYPVVVRPGVMCDYRTVRVDLGDLLDPLSLRVESSGSELKFSSSFDTWSWVGKAELLCNGRVVSAKEIVSFKETKVAIDFTLDPRPADQPIDLYVLRLTRADGRYLWSQPLAIKSTRLAESDEDELVTLPGLLREGDFDESWGKAMFTAEVKTLQVPEEEIYGFNLPMDDENAVYPRDIAGWNIATLGGGRKWGVSVPEAVPSVLTDAALPRGHERYYHFDGEDDRVLLQVRGFPHGVVTVEAWVRPEQQTSAGYILSDQNRGFDFGVSADGKLFSQRGLFRCYSSEPLAIDAWSHVAAVYDGSTMRLYVNGEFVGEKALRVTLRSINSIPVIGCKHMEYLQFSHFYRGDLAGLSVTANVLDPDDFKLLD